MGAWNGIPLGPDKKVFVWCIEVNRFNTLSSPVLGLHAVAPGSAGIYSFYVHPPVPNNLLHHFSDLRSRLNRLHKINYWYSYIISGVTMCGLVLEKVDTIDTLDSIDMVDSIYTVDSIDMLYTKSILSTMFIMSTVSIT